MQYLFFNFVFIEMFKSRDNEFEKSGCMGLWIFITLSLIVFTCCNCKVVLHDNQPIILISFMEEASLYCVDSITCNMFNLNVVNKINNKFILNFQMIRNRRICDYPAL